MSNKLSQWPVLSRYEGERLREVAFPLGGIGTGTISLGGRAQLRDFEVFNQPAKGFTPPCSFFAIWLQRPGDPPLARVLEGTLQPPYSGAFGMPDATAGLPRMRHVALEAAYPFARFTLRDPSLPVTAYLEAFNPLIPLDVERSSLPVAILRWVLVNESAQELEASISFSLMNCIGVDLAACAGGPSPAPWELPGLLGGNVNEVRTACPVPGATVVGLLMRSEKVPPRSPQDGTMAIAALAEQATLRRTWGETMWNRHILAFWDDFTADGKLEDMQEAPASPPGQGQVGSLAVPVRLFPQGSASLTFLLAWHFPHRTAAGCGWDTLDPTGGWVGNYYALQYRDAWDVITKVVPDLPALEEETLRFVRAFVSSNLPQAVKEAALNNISTLRSQTCFRTADGNFFGFEGCCNARGCCFGSCTHVWNYEQTTPFLFPQLAKNMAELALDWGTNAQGMNSFRLRLPLGQEPWPHAAADGQMGVVMKCYREWQLSGDDAFLHSRWPKIRSLLEYCWLPGSWDADQDGVMEGVQHNTYDVEFFGPNPLTGIWYLGALRAAEEMARAVGDESFAQRCRTLFQKGSEWIDSHLFNGEYYVQKLQVPSSCEQVRPELWAGMGAKDLREPEFQLGEGCLIDQLVGQYMAHVVGLGYLLQPTHVRAAAEAIFRYNFRENLFDHWNNLRTFALNDESALLICSWPRGGRPKVPFPYFAEVMTGFEYQAAALMIYEGLVEEGLRVAEAVRARFDGHRRNPWNEQECGHHYARAMAAWALILALSGFRYSAVRQELELQPRWWQEGELRCPWAIPTGWGMVTHAQAISEHVIRWEVLQGQLRLRSMRYLLPLDGQRIGATVAIQGEPVHAQLLREGKALVLMLESATTIAAGQELVVRLQPEN